MEFSFLFSRTQTFCFVIFMMKQAMVDLDETVINCVTEIECATECLNRNCTSFGLNETINRCYIHFEENTVPDNESILWHKCNSKPEMLDDFAEAELRRASFEKGFCKSSAKETHYPFPCMDVDETVKSDKVYTIYPKPPDPYDVQCMITENKTWTIIQRREDGSQDFYLNWTDYKHGFGTKDSEYWLGNEALYLLTSKASFQLLIQLEDYENNTRFALYDTFSVANESSLYRITVSGYSGNAGDSMDYQNGQAFSTKDRDNDQHNNVSCAITYHGAWWYNACLWSNLNGQYLSGSHISFADGVNWYSWRGVHYSYKVCRMLIRRK